MLAAAAAVTSYMLRLLHVLAAAAAGGIIRPHIGDVQYLQLLLARRGVYDNTIWLHQNVLGFLGCASSSAFIPIIRGVLASGGGDTSKLVREGGREAAGREEERCSCSSSSSSSSSSGGATPAGARTAAAMAKPVERKLCSTSLIRNENCVAVPRGNTI